MNSLPHFSLQASDGHTYTQETLQKGTWVIYAYPKDNTPGCTREAEAFRDHYPAFQDLGVTILGLSKDSLKSHTSFCTKYSLPFSLLSDPDGTLLEGLGAWGEKKMYGKSYLGIIRSTYLIKDGQIVHTWPKVKVKGHAEEVLEACQNLAQS